MSLRAQHTAAIWKNTSRHGRISLTTHDNMHRLTIQAQTNTGHNNHTRTCSKSLSTIDKTLNNHFLTQTDEYTQTHLGHTFCCHGLWLMSSSIHQGCLAHELMMLFFPF